MRITRLELRDFRSISHLIFDDLPDTVVLVSPNGVGKSTILESVAGTKDLVVPYYGERYQFFENRNGKNTPTWPPNLRRPVRFGASQAKVSLEVKPNDRELEFLRAKGIDEGVGKVAFVIEEVRFVESLRVNHAIRSLFEFHTPAIGVGFLDYIQPFRYFPGQGVGDIN